MVDQFGRAIDYLRVSVTDRCNLRCVYCMPEGGIEKIPHGEILTFEEITRVVEAAAALGVQKIKITGGEPLVRLGVEELIRQLKQINGIQNVTMTTNGVKFEEMGEKLAAAGLDGVNFSLDCLDKVTFYAITRVDAFSDVIKGIELSLKLKLRTRVNCVPIGELNSDCVNTMASLAQRYPLDMRFIELMPIGLGKNYTPVKGEIILQKLAGEYGEPVPSLATHGNGPAAYYDFPGFKGSIGFISPISSVFCGSCNRVRLTAEGALKPCLCCKEALDLKPLLRNGATESQLAQAMQKAIFYKPLRHNLDDASDKTAETKNMVQIGG